MINYVTVTLSDVNFNFSKATLGKIFQLIMFDHLESNKSLTLKAVFYTEYNDL